MSKLRDTRKGKRLAQIEDTGVYVRNVPLGEIEALQDKIPNVKEEHPNEKFTEEEAYIFLLFRDYLVDKDGSPFEDIEGPEDLHEVLDIDLVKKIFRYFGLGMTRAGN